MNLLLDFITLRVKTGAGEYVRTIVLELVKRLHGREDVRLFALYDSAEGIAYEDMREEPFGRENAIKYVDCHGNNVATIAKDLGIDRIFVGCAQYISQYSGIADLACQVIVAVHDCYAEELAHDNIYEYFLLVDGSYDYRERFRYRVLNQLRHLRLTWLLAKRIFDGRRKGWNSSYVVPVTSLVRLYVNNRKTFFLVPSSFSKFALCYHYGIQDDSRIVVRFCPERIPSKSADIQDGALSEIIQSRRKFFLMVSANRRPKNPYKLVKAFERFCQFNDDIDLVVVNYPRKGSERVHVLPFLSDGDLAHALKNCYALVYPSFFEGFGYPPLEAMKYGKPVLSSNVTSMPEILGDAPIYFSPFYNADIFKAMMTLAELSEEEYTKRSEMSLEQYKVVHQRQERDLQRLLDMILEPVESMND